MPDPPPDDPSAVLDAGLRQLMVPEPERARTLLERYLDEIERWNPRFGLVEAAGRRQLVVRHVLDSLTAWSAIRARLPDRGGTILDVGSGAGLPGIPLAVALPEAAVTLLERMARRASFLRTCVVLLDLPTVRVERANLSEAGGAFDVLTFRGVAPLDRFLSELLRSRVRFRVAVAYKGKRARAAQEVRAALAAWPGRLDVEIRGVRVPFLDEERCLVIASNAGADSVDKAGPQR